MQDEYFVQIIWDVHFSTYVLSRTTLFYSWKLKLANPILSDSFIVMEVQN